jgi:hypothetical protein
MTPTPLHVLCGAVLSGTSPPTQQNRTFTFYVPPSSLPPLQRLFNFKPLWNNPMSETLEVF